MSVFVARVNGTSCDHEIRVQVLLPVWPHLGKCDDVRVLLSPACVHHLLFKDCLTGVNVCPDTIDFDLNPNVVCPIDYPPVILREHQDFTCTHLPYLNALSPTDYPLAILREHQDFSCTNLHDLNAICFSVQVTYMCTHMNSICLDVALDMVHATEDLRAKWQKIQRSIARVRASVLILCA